jgi:O-acetyl-ADP-ribose deacetylase (regulator of RNase III)
MSKFAFKVIGEREAWDAILGNKGNFVPWIGAGVSIESRIPGAQQICEEIANDLIAGIEKERKIYDRPPFQLTEKEKERILDEQLSWRDASVRYFRSIKKRYPGLPERVDYFRRLVAHRSPSFGHYATALLMGEKIFSPECITTNFDKLLERAFSDIGAMECQPIRTPNELQYYRQYGDKSFCIKIHGDYDTHNLLNTEDETVIIEEKIVDSMEGILKNKGVVVLGSGGFEKSIHTLFDTLTTKDASDRRVLQYGLLWGTYVESGSGNPEEEALRRIENGSISTEIMKVMDRSFRAQSLFAFFPVVDGAGEFLRRLIIYSENQGLLQVAEPYFDHDMRIRSIFRRQHLSEKAITEHLKRLQLARERLDNASVPVRPAWAFRDQKVSSGPFALSLCYGSLADTQLLVEGKSGCKRAGILSPDDTFISIGGGTALAIAKAAGYRNIVHDVSKLAPIPLGDVAVTTAGNLPVEYVLHGASVEIREEGLLWSEENIRNTVRNALLKCTALEIDVLFLPLLAAGTGRASASVSVSQILQAIFEFGSLDEFHKTKLAGIKVVIVVYQESELPRQVFRDQFDAIFAGQLN